MGRHDQPAPGRSAPPRWHRALVAILLVVALLGGSGEQANAEAETEAEHEAEHEAERLGRLAAAEETLLLLMPKLKILDASVKNFALPDAAAAGLFAERAVVVGGAGGDTVRGEQPLPIPGVERWTVGAGSGDAAVAPGELPVWREIFAGAAAFDNVAFYIAGGDLVERDGDRVFVAEAGISALVLRKGGGLRALDGRLAVEWTETDAGWKISRWVQGHMEQTDSGAPFFREVLDEVVPDEIARSRARFSYHEKNIVDLFTKGGFAVAKPIYARFKDLDSSMQHPALSVVDIDGDGWDDLYVMDRWGQNLLLRNRGDGTMEDVAAMMGLDLEGLCNCACFADFDNDGDVDVFVGRSLERSLYLRNDGGRFVDATKEALGSMPLPYLVSTISAADYDGDGLLDVYLGLYGPTERDGKVEEWGPAFLPPAMVAEMLKRREGSHRYLNLVGPPNLLLKNMGGGTFRVAPEAEPLAGWHNTHTGCWTDFDDDGDLDLYVCNDFAPDHLYRQGIDPETGARSFVEVSEAMAGTAMQGFGMGASWGDYDRDGDLDLYVSNMYSKAGKRITAAIAGLDPRVPYSASGNLLFRNDQDAFTQVAGVGDGDMAVAKAGWAYGAQWVDVDNDGWLDIYSSSGFFTAPKPIRTDRDL
ncbi:hypothetical protein BH23VER1_BH23VER1_11610 [soil metagenome]